MTQSGEFVRKLVGMMDQHRQALWANPHFVPRVLDGEQGRLLLSSITTQATIVLHSLLREIGIRFMRGAAAQSTAPTTSRQSR